MQKPMPNPIRVHPFHLIFFFIIILGITISSCQQKDVADQEDNEAPTVVFVTGDDEYHSREVMRPYAKKLEEDYGFKVIYIADESPGADEDPDHDPKPTVLKDADKIKEADLMVVFIRFRNWEPNSLKLFMDHFDSGKPAVAIRTTTHAFWNDRTFSPEYFGGHYKTHNNEFIVGQINPAFADHPMARGVRKKFGEGEGPYVSVPLSEGATPIMLSYGHNRPKSGIGNDHFDSPQYPVAWAYNHKEARRAMITLGSDRVSDHDLDFMQDLFYNSIFWSLGYEVPENGVLAAGDSFEMVKESNPYEPKEPNLPSPPSFDSEDGEDDWTMLFDGQNLDQWKHWDISLPPYGVPLDRRAYSVGPIDYALSPARWEVKDGATLARVGYGDIITKEAYIDYELRLDFLIPEEPEWVTGEWRGNSGVFLNGSYEIAILDSHGKEATKRSNGSIFGRHAPKVEASKPAGAWQTLEVALEQGRATVRLNGQLIHDNVKLGAPTKNGFPAPQFGPDSWQEEDEVVTQGPIRLQAESSYVRFANIAIRPL